MIINENQIMRLLIILNDHIDLHSRINLRGNEYTGFLVALRSEILGQQSEELCEVKE